MGDEESQQTSGKMEKKETPHLREQWGETRKN